MGTNFLHKSINFCIQSCILHEEIWNQLGLTLLTFVNTPFRAAKAIKIFPGCFSAIAQMCS